VSPRWISQRVPMPRTSRRQQILARRARWRRWRARSRAGIAVASVPYDANVVTVLVQLRYLPDHTVSSPAAVGAAIGAAMKSLTNR